MPITRTGIVLAGLLLAASAVAAAEPPARAEERPSPPIGADSAGMFFVSYPSASLRRNEEGTAHYRLNVDRAGRALDCVVTRGTGFANLDELTCAAAVHHARLRPAINEQGRPVPSVYEGSVVWTIG